MKSGSDTYSISRKEVDWLFDDADETSQTKYFHSFNVFGKMFIIPRRYSLEKVLGQGSYGIVCKAIDTSNNEEVAIKKMFNPFKIPGNIIRVLREIRLLKFLNHENIIQIKDLFPAVSVKAFESIYVVTEYMSSDLMQIIHSNNSLTEEHVKFILFQILSALKYLHSADIIHRDLKPSNILINEDCEIKIWDFGLARAVQRSEHAAYDMTQYVTTRIYRAPELLFNLGEYTRVIDVWSVGWIFAEMLNRRPLFYTKNEFTLMTMIINLVGSAEELSSSTFAKYRDVIKKFKVNDGDNEAFEKMFSAHSEEARDLLRQMLKIDPSRRITVDQALRHSYFSGYEEELEDLEDCTRTFDAAFEELQGNPEVLKGEVLKEIFSFYPGINEEQFNQQNQEYKTLRRGKKVHHILK